MAEPLKNLLYPGLVERMAGIVSTVDAAFDKSRFIDIAAAGMDALELMHRAQQIRDALIETLPVDFPQAAAILSASLPKDGRPGLSGWELLPVNQFIAAKGLPHLDIGLWLLKALTPHFTAEFGIRAFIHSDQDRALATIRGWVGDPNHHVRRLASEGTRPRLPWAMRLPALIRDPKPILPILTALIDDPEDYVRRSVANSLNDIAKDHPDLVAAFVRDAIAGASVQRRQLLRHASRTLLKKGHGEALANFGFAPAPAVRADLAIETPVVEFGTQLRMAVTLVNAGQQPQRLMIDYAIHHRKANGQLAPKVFKWTSLTLGSGETISLTRQHAMRAITTRQYYAGGHSVDILVNGAVLGRGDFQLAMP